MNLGEAKTEAVRRYGSDAWAKESALMEVLNDDGTREMRRFCEVFKGYEMHIYRWGIGRTFTEAFDDCERRGEIPDQLSEHASRKEAK